MLLAFLSCSGFGDLAFATECTSPDAVPPRNSVLYRYVNAAGETDENFVIAAVGNEYVALDEDLKPIDPEELAKLVLNDPTYSKVERVRLEWPYSTRGTAPFAKALQALVKKPVVGYPGAVWWYADGVMISSSKLNGAAGKPTPVDAGECAASDGLLQPRDKCAAIASGHAKVDAIFSNMTFDLDCKELALLALRAEQGEREARRRLFNYYMFVNRDDGKARSYFEPSFVESWLYDAGKTNR